MFIDVLYHRLLGALTMTFWQSDSSDLKITTKKLEVSEVIPGRGRDLYEKYECLLRGLDV